VSIAGQRLYRADPTDATAIRAFGEKLLRLLERPWPLKEGKRNELELPILPISKLAEAVWREFYDHVEKQSGRAGELGVIADFAGKAAEHAARIAGVLTVVQDPSATEILEAEMVNAVTLVDWYICEALRLASASMARWRRFTAYRSESADNRSSQRPCRDDPRSHAGHPRQGKFSPQVRRRGGSERPACTPPPWSCLNLARATYFLILPVFGRAATEDRQEGLWIGP
jgi:hypothetical protein